LSKALNCWFAVDLVSRSTVGKSKWAGFEEEQLKASWLDIHWLARNMGGLVAAIFEVWF
jgi:hypothetical protein